MKKVRLLVVLFALFMLACMISCLPLQLGAIAAKTIINVATSSDDPCKGKSTLWDPGSKKYYCYDNEGNKIYK